MPAGFAAQFRLGRAVFVMHHDLVQHGRRLIPLPVAVADGPAFHPISHVHRNAKRPLQRTTKAVRRMKQTRNHHVNHYEGSDDQHCEKPENVDCAYHYSSSGNCSTRARAPLHHYAPVPLPIRRRPLKIVGCRKRETAHAQRAVFYREYQSVIRRRSRVDGW
jgi:hypothetical protein